MTEAIDIERTASVYKSQLDSFMSSFIMNCSPFDEDEESLLTESRARGCKCGYSWLDRAQYFCSCHYVKSVEEISLEGYRPYLDIKFTPSLDALTSNWFIWECRPCFEKMVTGIECLEHDLGGYTKSRFIDIQEASDQLEFLNNHVGDEIIMCYRFLSVNNFNKQRACYRFSKKESLREAILLTQGFVLDYLENHPLDCFNGPFTEDGPLDISYLDNIKKWEILSPILDSYLPSFRARKDWVESQLHMHKLMTESI
jgi:hypothetical protein